MRYRLWIRLIHLAGLSLALGLLFAVTPAEACGCGIYIPREGAANVSQERSLIRWDGQTEDIVMSLDVQSSSAEAAWILPVPAPATVQLADPHLFETLQELTKPRQERRLTFGGPFMLGGSSEGAPTGGAAPVTVLGRQSLGPFEVSSLAASEATALSDWLAANGYTFPPDLAESLRPYVDQEWYYVAVRLSPAEGTKPLAGALDPLWVTFPSEELVYPMRLSARAKNSLLVNLYVLAEHRVQPSTSFGASRIFFADWLEPASLAAGSPLKPFIGQKMFLTKFQDYIYSPNAISGDYIFNFTTADTTYHEVEVVYVDNLAGIPTGALLAGAICLVPLMLAAGARSLLRRRRQAGALT